MTTEETTGRDWYPVIFAELERIGATEAGIGVRELGDELGDGGIWIEFVWSGRDLGGCDINDAPEFLDSMSAGEGSDPSDFARDLRAFFDGYGDDEDDDDDGDEEE
jgi:hypothetical protein